jgi:hypothetical protein
LPASNQLAKHSSFGLSAIKFKPYFALATSIYQQSLIDKLARILTAFGTQYGQTYRLVSETDAMFM